MTQHITASVVRPLISDDREHITLHIDAPGAAPLSISFNRDLLRRVLDSLIWLDAAPPTARSRSGRTNRPAAP
ncbi:MAG: hypothetical protein AB7H70_05370 [Rhodospirillaceae bacterium]